MTEASRALQAWPVAQPFTVMAFVTNVPKPKLEELNVSFGPMRNEG